MIQCLSARDKSAVMGDSLSPSPSLFPGLGIDPTPLCMLGKCFATVLHPEPSVLLFSTDKHYYFQVRA